MRLSEWASALAKAHLALSLPLRWAHVQGVARRADDVRGLGDGDRELLKAAAVLHDIGYAPAVVVSGFHPLDGAQFLVECAAPARLVGLVAHHSAAAVEARLRGLEQELHEFADERGSVRDALWYCDLTTGPGGEPLSAGERLDEIQDRYGPDHLVTRFIGEARGELLGAVARTEARLEVAGQPR